MQHGNGDVAYNGHAINKTTSDAAGASQPISFNIEEADTMQDDARFTRNVSAYKMERKVGEGAYGAVFFARDLKDGEVVALKRVAWSGDPSNSEGLPVTTLREIMLLFAVRHENVVHLKEVLHGAALCLHSPTSHSHFASPADPIIAPVCDHSHHMQLES